MAVRTRTFELSENPATKPDPVDNPLWMRWNNYGIANGLMRSSTLKAYAPYKYLEPKSKQEKFTYC